MIIVGLILFPIATCIFSGIFRSNGVRLAYLWLSFVIVASLAWITMLIINPNNISPFILHNWYDFEAYSANLVLKINDQNWPILLIYFSSILLFLMTSIVHLRGNASLYSWIEVTILVISASIALFAGDYWTILIAWVLMDLLELIIYYRHQALTPNQLFVHLSLKFFGSILLVYAISNSFPIYSNRLFEKSSEGIGLIVLLAVFLHSGAIINFSDHSKEYSHQNIPVFLARFLSFISSFFLLAKVSPIQMNIIFTFLGKIMLSLLSLWGILKWQTGKNETMHLNTVLIALGALFGYLFLSGFQEGFIYFLIVGFISIIWLFSFTQRNLQLYIFGGFVLLMISGLPFSLSFIGLKEITSEGNLLDLITVIVILAIFIASLIKHGYKEKGNFENQEPWYQAIYLVGLFIPVIAMIAIVIKSTQLFENLFLNWWIGATILLISFLTSIFFLKTKRTRDEFDDSEYEPNVEQSPWMKIPQVVMKYLSETIAKSLHFISGLFEGEGGILWAIVFLALLLTILSLQRGI